MHKKKIIIINQYGVTPDVPGATKHYDMGLNFADKKEYNVEYWLSGLNHKTGNNHRSLKGLKFQSKETITKNFQVVRFKGFPYRGNLILRQLSIILFEIITAFKILFSRKIKIVIINTPPVGIINILATKIRRKKLIVDVEDLWPLFLQEMGMNNKLVIIYMTFCSKISYAQANMISTVSQGMFDYVVKIKGADTNVWISPLGVDINLFLNKEKNNTLIEDKVWAHDFKIMYLGAHGKANDIISVLNTIKEFNKIDEKICSYNKTSFIFIGDGDYKDNIMSHATDIGVENVYFEDPVPGSLVPDYLAHADVCLTNLQKIESFKLVRPNKLFQYMALGKPIISGIWGEFREIIETENTGIYVDFTNAFVAAREILLLLSNEDLLRTMGINGADYVLSYGNREIIFQEYYSNILK